MKISLYFFAILSLFVAAGCDKDHADDLKGEKSLAGRLMHKNAYTGKDHDLPLGGKKVFIAYNPSDQLNYIYSVVTDAQGYFRFTNLEEKRAYDIFYADSIGGLKYHASVTRKPGIDTLYLLATPDMAVQNGLAIIVQDSAGSNIQGVDAYVYDSYEIFKADSAAGTTTGAKHKFASNEYGRDAWFNIAPATYYVMAREERSGILLLGFGRETVKPAGVTTLTIKLAGPDKYAKNGLVLRVKDQWGNSMQGAKGFVYDSYELYRTDSTAGTTGGAMHQLTTNAYGKASWLNIVPRQYFVIAKKENGGTVLTGYGRVAVPANDTAGVDINVSLPAPAPMVRITVLDVFNTPVSGADVYLYTSLLTANLDSTYTAYTFKMASSNTGIATAGNIPAATYYLKATKAINDTTLKGTGLIHVKPAGYSDTTIHVQ